MHPPQREKRGTEIDVRMCQRTRNRVRQITRSGRSLWWGENVQNARISREDCERIFANSALASKWCGKFYRFFIDSLFVFQLLWGMEAQPHIFHSPNHSQEKTAFRASTERPHFV